MISTDIPFLSGELLIMRTDGRYLGKRFRLLVSALNVRTFPLDVTGAPDVAGTFMTPVTNVPELFRAEVPA